MKVLKRVKVILLFAIYLIVTTSCNNKDEPLDEAAADSLVGKWYLKNVNNTDVSKVECYKDSFIECNGENIVFYILDRQKDGTCKTVLNLDEKLIDNEGFYYVGDEALDFTIEGNQLTWRYDVNSILIFKK